MKRYDFRVKNGVPGLYAVEDGDYYFVPDVTRTMIPRPDAEEARKALIALVNAAKKSHILPLASAQRIKERMAEVLALMGVENA